jgi:HAD superfamily hydrolase (TIGR01549 family)
MNNKVLLWDLGNVVVRWSPDEILARLGYASHTSDYLLHSLFGHSDWLDLDRGVTTESIVAERLVAESDLTTDEAMRVFDVVRETLVDIEHSVTLIETLARDHHPMYVLSNMSKPNADYLRQRPYFKHFKGVVISAEEKLNKPSPELFERVLARYDLKPESVLFIDDTKVNIDAAGALGMQGLVFEGSADCYAKINQFISG